MVRSRIRLLLGLISLTGLLIQLGGLSVAAGPKSVAPLPDEMVKRVVTPTELVATVGDESIFAGDVLPRIDQMLAPAADKVPPALLDQQRAQYVRQLLPRQIDIKLILLDFYRTIPSDKLDEVLQNIEKQTQKQFYDEYVVKLQEQMEVESLRDLDAKLREFGSSIEQQKAEFRDQMLAQTMIGQQSEAIPEITHDDLLEYYQEHLEDYTFEAQAQWEKLTALFEKYPSKAAADRAIVEMGNQVLRGANLATVAKKHSQGTNAWEGGFHDWTTKGSLLSTVLDQAIFSLPVDRLSRIIEDDRGLHIVRVLDRRDAGQTPFEEAQEEIREKLEKESRDRLVREYLEGLRKKTYLHTIFDDLDE